MPLKPQNPANIQTRDGGVGATSDKNYLECWEFLLKQYQAITKAYAEAVADLPNGRSEEFNDKWMRSESSRRAAVGARADLLEQEYKNGRASPVSIASGGDGRDDHRL